MMKVLLALALVIGLAAPVHSAQAQATNASLDDSLSRLSEILGALHYLRPICGFKEADRWRTEMQALIDAEAQGADRRARMVAGFNRGYGGFQQTYRTCTPAAEVAIRRYLEEGAKIAREVTARYAN
ncbi:MAG: TIGR02301 family protein [Xanthobacteraceae bacterium]|nr:TIGR02301 family protein [Xanthobacteraceae bacterium]